LGKKKKIKKGKKNEEGLMEKHSLGFLNPSNTWERNSKRGGRERIKKKNEHRGMGGLAILPENNYAWRDEAFLTRPD